jgi:hypothetical protein
MIRILDEIQGKTIECVRDFESGSESVMIYMKTGEVYRMHHNQD